VIEADKALNERLPCDLNKSVKTVSFVTTRVAYMVFHVALTPRQMSSRNHVGVEFKNNIRTRMSRPCQCDSVGLLSKDEFCFTLVGV